MTEKFSEKTPRNIAKKTHEMMMSLAQKDQLTGLLNRRGVLSVTEYVISTLKREKMSPSITVTMLDMIGLKALNKKYTETGADKIIKTSTEAISKSVRESDIVGRWGGDEFVIVSIDTDSEGTKTLISKVKDSQPEEVHYNAIFRVYEPGIDIGQAINNVFENMEKVKRTLPQDKTGRSTGEGITVELH